MKMWRWIVVGAAGMTAVAALGKPPAVPKDEKKTTPTDNPAPASFLRWLLLQNGGPDAISVSWPELVRAATGKQVTPLDPGNPADAAIATKIGAALDQVLPRLNRPESTLRSMTPLTSVEIATRVADEVRTTLGAAGGATVTNPSFWYVDPASRQAYHLTIALYPTGGREGSVRALAFSAAEGGERIDADGRYLLLALEHNGKTGKDLAFLNWELIDLAKVSVRCAVGFEADENAVHQPGAVVTDGRKGRD